MSIWQKIFGPPNIEKLEGRRDVSGLVKMLRDPLVGGKAADALARIAASGNGERNVCLAAFEALRNIGDVRALEPLIAASRDSHREMREAPVNVLERIDAPAELDPIISEIQGRGLPKTPSTELFEQSSPKRGKRRLHSAIQNH